MILDGKLVAEKIKEKVRLDVLKLQQKGIYPKLCVIIVGERPDSMKYIKNKETACKKVGIISEVITLPENISEECLMAKLNELNNDASVHGILVQYPLPEHISEDNIANHINPLKDVDCFHPFNVGKMFLGRPYTMPCTPHGIIEILNNYNIQIDGKKAVVVGRSNIVGKPMGLLLTQHNASVMVLHSKTSMKLMKAELEEADIIVCAIGSANFLSTDIYVPRKGQYLIDVGMNFIEGKMVGDIAMNLKELALAYTPVPGGVGQTTVAILLQNCIICCLEQTRGN